MSGVGQPARRRARRRARQRAAARACGEEHGIEALTTGRVPLGAMDAHTAGAVGLLVTGAGAYFAGAHEGGRIALLVEGE